MPRKPGKKPRNTDQPNKLSVYIRRNKQNKTEASRKTTRKTQAHHPYEQETDTASLRTPIPSKTHKTHL